jgi:hypothetical protein
MVVIITKEVQYSQRPSGSYQRTAALKHSTVKVIITGNPVSGIAVTERLCISLAAASSHHSSIFVFLSKLVTVW